MDEEKKRGRGHPPHEPTPKQREIVESSSALGIPHTDIAVHIGIDNKTLRKYYRAELDNGAYKANYKVGGVLYQMATQAQDESVRFRAAAFWAARRMGWSEKQDQVQSSHEVTVRVIGGPPVEGIEDGGEE